MEQRTLLAWGVMYVDRQSRKHANRTVYLDTGTLSPADATTVLKAANTMELVRHRNLFTELRPAISVLHAIKAFSLTPLYYEDEAGNPLRPFEFNDLVFGTRGSYAILGNAESALRIGPTAITNPNDWTVEKADTIAHFLEIVKYLMESTWIRTPASFEYTVRGGNAFRPAGQQPKGVASKPRNFKRPDLYTINAVLVLIRQLFSGDKLFEDTCDTYARHCSHPLKLAFVQFEQAMFRSTLTEEPLLAQGYTGSEILRLFLYEFGLVHLPEPAQRKSFRQMIEKNGKEPTFLAFQSTLQNLTHHAMNLASVVAQDFAQWIEKDKHIGPERISFDEILRETGPVIETPLATGDMKIELSTGGTRSK